MTVRSYSCATDRLAVVPSKTRKRCPCCPGRGYERSRATHALTAGGCCMGVACEFHAYKWLREDRARQIRLRGQVVR
jgi:hypothetical protein